MRGLRSPARRRSSPTYRLLYEHAAGLMAFGGIGSPLPSTTSRTKGARAASGVTQVDCATWFLQVRPGRDRIELLEGGHQLLGTAEESLARWCVIELDVGGRGSPAACSPRPGASRRCSDPGWSALSARPIGVPERRQTAPGTRRCGCSRSGRAGELG